MPGKTLIKELSRSIRSSLAKTLPGAVAEKFTTIKPEEFSQFLEEWFQKEYSRVKAAPRDANSPKRNKSPYLFFCEETRTKISKQSPELSMTDVSKELGKTWRALSEADKRKYQKMADEDKVRYERELAAYKQHAQ